MLGSLRFGWLHFNCTADARWGSQKGIGELLKRVSKGRPFIPDDWDFCLQNGQIQICVVRSIAGLGAS
jgi:hypothetical protein